jgi:hypothetical protein
MDFKQLKQNYDNAVNAILKAFCIKHELEDTPYWIGDEIGGIASIADYFVSLQTMIDDLQFDAPENEFLKWYDYCENMTFLGSQTTPNFKSWLKGCPRKSDDEIAELKERYAKIEEDRDAGTGTINIISKL